VFIPETTSLPDIYALLTKQRVHMAIVLDEHGGTAGLLTLEDVLEVIVGEIDDEYHFTNINIRKLGDHTWLVAGNTLLTELNEQLGVDLRPNEAYTTVAGLVLAKLGHIPRVGEILVANNLTFTVRSMERLRIDRVLVSAKNESF
jgi:putative hemolysin